MADILVQAAQDWVNATYGNVAGFEKAPQPGSANYGKTGWSTIYPLTRALQYELGISPLTDNFGPLTLSKLTQRGGIKRNGETNTNIIKLMVYACYCKGYGAGPATGVFHNQLALAIQKMSQDMGITGSFNGVISPKVVKALFNMNAYVITSGGTDAVRSAQQWLNSKYVNRQDFFFMPCDGVFSRDVQKALVLGIQYELGMADGVATGAIGDATRNGLKTKTLASGSTGVFVNLFTAAMVFNGLKTANQTPAVFTSTYSAFEVSVVQNFQKSTVLPNTSGSVDYQTWMELLVSTGDPTRPANACDLSVQVTDAKAKALKAAGYRVVGRYLDNVAASAAVPNPKNKKIQPGELATIFANGLRVFPISQYYGGEVGYFTYATGQADANKAYAAAVAYGFGPGTVIYFAVDYDATQTEVESNVIPYFQGIVSALRSKGGRYLHGVYGSRNVCTQVSQATNAVYSFISGMSTGFSGNLGFPHPINWSFNQIQTNAVVGTDGIFEIDRNVWRPGTDPATAAVNATQSPVSAFLAYVQSIYTHASAYNSAKASVLVLDYLRSAKYNGLQWDAAIGPINQEGVQYIRDRIGAPGGAFVDPSYGVSYDVAHFAVVCLAYCVYPNTFSVTKLLMSDASGWAGDTMTFYGEWRLNSDSIASGRVWVEQRFAKTSASSSFGLPDIIADADAVLVAKAVLGGRSIVQALTEHFATNGAYKTRVSKFIQLRMGGPSNVEKFIRDALTGLGEPNIVTTRALLIRYYGSNAIDPTLLPSASLDPFITALATGFKALA